MLKSNFFVSGINLFGIILSFLTQLLIARLIGTSMERDAYFVAMAVPGYLSSIFISAFGVVFLPKLIQIQRENVSACKAFTFNTLNLIFIFLSLIALAGIIYANEIISITAIGFEDNELEMASLLLKLLFPTIVFQGLSSILTSVSQSQNKFVLPAISPVLSSFISLVFVLAFTSVWGIKSLAIGTLVGNFMGMGLLFFFTLKEYRFHLNFTDEGFLNIVILSIPLFLSGFVTRSGTLFERFVASTLPNGSISYLGYATQIHYILSSIAVSGLGTVIFPVLAKKWAENDKESTRQVYESGIRLVLMITIPIAILFFFEGIPIIKLIYERGKFLHSSTVIVSQLFSLLTLSFICNCMGSVVRKIFYLSGKTFFVSISDVVLSLLYFFMAFILIKFYSFYGLAVASSINALLSCIVTISMANRILKGLDFHFIFKDPIILLIASIGSVIISKFIVISIFGHTNQFGFFLTQIGIVFVLIYIFLGLTKVKELAIINDFLFNVFFRKIGGFLKKQIF